MVRCFGSHPVTQESGEWVKCMVMVPWKHNYQNTKGTFKISISMVRDGRHLRMVMSLREHTHKDIPMVKVSIDGRQKVVYFEEVLRKARGKEKDPGRMIKEIDILGTTTMISNQAMENSIGKVVISTREVMWMIFVKVMERCIGGMGQFIRGNGRREFNTEGDSCISLEWKMSQVSSRRMSLWRCLLLNQPSKPLVILLLVFPKGEKILTQEPLAEMESSKNKSPIVSPQ